MNKIPITEEIISLRKDKRLSLGEISVITGISKTSLARKLRQFQLSNEEKKDRWRSSVNNRTRLANGQLLSAKKLCLIGKKYNCLTIKQFMPKTSRHLYVLCKCDCGKEKTIRLTSVINGEIFSCGCFAALKARELYGFKCSPGEASFISLYNKYKGGAKSRKINFSLDKVDCQKLFTGNCFYCGIEPRQKHNYYANKRTKSFWSEEKAKIGDFYFNGIDRLNPLIGYENKNCVSCCKYCNYAKRDLSLHEFEAYLDRLVNFRKVKEIYE